MLFKNPMKLPNKFYKSFFLIITILFSHIYCFSQTTISKQENNNSKVNFTDVRILLLINYPHKLSSGAYNYSKYTIQKGKNEFLIEGKSIAYKQTYKWEVPFTFVEINGSRKSDKKNDILIHVALDGAKSDKYVSEKITYSVGGKSYVVYKHINYNCYDPRCGAKHNHTTFNTGETYFSPEYGILVEVDDQKMQYNLLAKIKEKNVPHELVIQILKNIKADNKIIQEYIRKTKK